MKKIITILVVLFLMIRVSIFDTYALSVAPVAGEALVELVGGLLVSSGNYTVEEVSNMSWNECKTAIDSGIASGTINPLDVTGNVTLLESDGSQITVQANFMEYVDYLTNPNTEVVSSDLLLYGSPTERLQGVVDDIINYGLPQYETKANWVNGLKKGDVVRTSSSDLEGYSSMLILWRDREKGFYTCYYSNNGGLMYNDRYQLLSYDYYVDYQYFNKAFECAESGKSHNFSRLNPDGTAIEYELVGNWTTTEGEVVEYGATESIGETADGEEVTLEDIQSGAVSLDDTKLNYDSFTDEAIIDLLGDILGLLDTIPVAEEDTSTYDDAKENIQDAIGELDVAELNNLQMPLGIIDVFPFCLPFDFVRGMKLLSAEPETPYFEVNIVVPSFLGIPEQKWDFVIDFEMLEPLAIITRWTSLLSFSYVLIFISTKIVKGAGA